MSNKRITYPVKGFWRVRTEGDCEGRSIRDLGVHEGYVDEIAFKLAKEQEYGLRFDLVDPKALKDSEKTHATKVNVSLGIDSGTWDMPSDELVEYWENFLKDRNVSVGECNYYTCVTLYPGRNNPAVAERTKKKLEAERNAARNKLTIRERQLLGVK